MQDILAALDEVDTLVERLNVSRSSKDPTRAAIQSSIAALAPVEEPDPLAVLAGLTMMKPHLKRLISLVKRGQITAQEIILAVEEALDVGRVNDRLTEKVGDVLRDVFNVPHVEPHGVGFGPTSPRTYPMTQYEAL